MPDFLKDLLSKVKYHADALDSPPSEPFSSVESPIPEHLTKKNITKPGLPIKPGLVPEPGLMSTSDHTQLLGMFLDSKGTNALSNPIKTLSELLLYHYFLGLACGIQPNLSEDKIIPYSQKEAMKATGIKSTATMVKAMDCLSKNKLITWVRKSRKRGEKSQIKVYLPGEWRK